MIRTRRKNRKKNFRPVVIAIIIAIVIVGLMFPRMSEYFDNTSEEGPMVLISIEEGSSAKMIAKNLKDLGLIKYEGNFVSKLKNSEYADSMRFGTYELHKGMCISDIITALATAPAVVDDVTVTIPEGYSVEKIAVLMEENGVCTAEDFLQALTDDYDYAFLNDVPQVDYKFKLQGFLFPDTYNFAIGASAHDVINVMLSVFEERYNSIASENQTDLSFYEIMTIASLIERESMLDEERPMISGVIKNRTELEMPLQIDATVLYAITDGLYDATVVLYKDLEADSLYNTYKYSGLPVGPICCPGLESILGAMQPAEHNYLYYHTDEVKKDGSHIFTETLEEHTATMN